MTFKGEKEPIYKKAIMWNGIKFESHSDLARYLGVLRQAITVLGYA